MIESQMGWLSGCMHWPAADRMKRCKVRSCANTAGMPNGTDLRMVSAGGSASSPAENNGWELRPQNGWNTLWWTNIAMENHHFNGKNHYKWPLSIAMLVHQRVYWKFLKYAEFSIDLAHPGPKGRTEHSTPSWHVCLAPWTHTGLNWINRKKTTQQLQKKQRLLSCVSCIIPYTSIYTIIYIIIHPYTVYLSHLVKERSGVADFAYSQRIA